MNQTTKAAEQIHPVKNRIGGVFMHVSNMERSVNWYHKLFGLPDRSSVTDKVHEITMDGGSGLVLDQHGYDRGLSMAERPLLMFQSPDVHAAYRFAKQNGIPIEWEIEQYPGMAFFTLRDPDGNLLMVCGNPGETESGNGSEPMEAAAVRYDGGGTWLAVSGNLTQGELTPEGLVLTGRAVTDESFRTPIRIETTLRLEAGCLRLLFGPHGELTFNYGPSASGGAGEEFYVNHPSLHKTFSYTGKGTVPYGQWVRVEWTIRERSMEIHLDGQLFHAQEGYFGDTVGLAGVGCDNGQVTVRSFFVEPLAVSEGVPHLAVSSEGEPIDELIPAEVCHPVITGDGLWLSYNDQWGDARTKAAYSVPFQCRSLIRTDTNSLVLYGGASAQVKFHTGGALSFIDPVTKEETWAEGKGALPNKWTEVIWKMESDRATITVDGEVRLEHTGDFSGCSFRLGIGPDQGSALVVKSVEVVTLI
ncbi:VOC family protein [Paenibacillus profundus]|uniref:VOC family protein n=1 Tax=Paenibacillus profundus TaxID=1173085 RepID=A0ABS8Y8X5_9BACL|nr:MULTISPECIES: VOC family protein [Paenibacillus]MCE5168251.1 VOC family protein [Paenibacillus profundus]